MNPDIRPWYHLLYITDQIKSADQKAYISVAVICAVTGFCHMAFSRVIHYAIIIDSHVTGSILVAILLFISIAGLLLSLSEFYSIVFPKIKSEKYLKAHERSAIFWYDVAMMSFDDFRNQYMKEDREDDLIVQIYVLSKIAQLKYSRIRKLFTITLFTLLCDIMILALSKII